MDLDDIQLLVSPSDSSSNGQAKFVASEFQRLQRLVEIELAKRHPENVAKQLAKLQSENDCLRDQLAASKWPGLPSSACWLVERIFCGKLEATEAESVLRDALASREFAPTQGALASAEEAQVEQAMIDDAQHPSDVSEKVESAVSDHGQSDTIDDQAAESSMIGSIHGQDAATDKESGPPSVMFGFAASKPSPKVERAPATWAEQQVVSRLRENKPSRRSNQDIIGELSTTRGFSQHWLYEFGINLLIIVNSLCLGLQVAHSANHGTPHPMEQYTSLIFIILFVLDLLLRLFESRCEFFIGDDMYWNTFDFIIVVCMVLERIAAALGKESAVFQNFGMFRPIRVLRLMRVVRVFKCFTVFREFQLLCETLKSGATWRILFWVTLVVGIFLYISALALTQSASDYCHSQDHGIQLCENFGSLSASLSILARVAYGGILWGQVMDDLQPLGPFPAIILAAFVMLSSMLVMNVINGLIVKAIFDTADQVQEYLTLKQSVDRDQIFKELVHLFHSMDIDGSRTLTSHEFDIAMQREDVANLFSSLKLQAKEMHELFNLLDVEHKGEVDIETFVLECFRLRGEARAMDVWHLQNGIQNLQMHMLELMSMLQKAVQPESTSLEERSKSHAQIAGMLHSGVAESSPFPSPKSETSRASLLCQALVHVPSTKTDVLDEFRDLLHTGQEIKKVENRSMSLRELRGVCDWIRRDCGPKQWLDCKTGSKLTHASANLYNFNHHVICPHSVPDGVTLRYSELKAGAVKQGEKVIQQSSDCYDKLPTAEGVVKSDSDGTSMEVLVLRGRFTSVLAGDVEVEGRSYGVPKDVYASNGRSMSYKELISSTPLAPLWYTSHYWGEPVLDFVACCGEHARSWGLHANTASYWVCGYANRQYELVYEIGNDLELSSFRKAMCSAKGTLLILDARAMPFERIWCNFELSKTMLDPSKLLDIVAMSCNRKPVLLSAKRPSSQCDDRFPLHLIKKGLDARLEDGQATVEADQIRILSNIAHHVTSNSQLSMAASDTGDWDVSVSEFVRRKSSSDTALPQISPVNNALHAYLALCVWPQVLKRGLVKDFAIPKLLKRDVLRKSVSLDCGKSELDDQGLGYLVGNLPPNLTSLQLKCNECARITLSTDGVRSGFQQLPRTLEVLQLSFEGCDKISSNGLVSLSRCLTPLRNLRQLRLNFVKCSDIDIRGVAALVKFVPRGVDDFVAVLLGTRVNCSITSSKELKLLKANASSLTMTKTRIYHRRARFEMGE